MPRICVSAAAPGLPAAPRLSRRSLMAALPAAGAALLITAPGRAQAGEDDTAILRLFRQRCAIMKAGAQHVCSDTCPDEDEEMDRLFYRLTNELDDEILALPSTCAADFAAKLIVNTACGHLTDDWHEGVIWEEARALTGLDLDGYSVAPPINLG